MRRPVRKASYSDSVLLAWKLYFGAYENSVPLGYFSTNPAAWCSLPADLSTYKHHVVLGYGLSCYHVLVVESRSVFSVVKSARTCACNIFLSWKSMWYSFNSSTHFVIWRVKSCLCKICLKGAFMSMITGCDWKYSRNFQVDTTKQNMCFSSGVYCVSVPLLYDPHSKHATLFNFAKSKLKY